MKVYGFEYTGYRSRIADMSSYFEANMQLLYLENLNRLFPEERPVYTKVRDEAPVRYALGCKVKNCTVADGCIIEGEVENCVIFPRRPYRQGRCCEELRAHAGHAGGPRRPDGLCHHRQGCSDQ